MRTFTSSIYLTMQATVSVNLLFVAWETKTVPKILPKISHAFQTALNILNNRLAISLQVLEPNLRARGSLVWLNGLYWMKKLLQPKHLSHSSFRRVRSFRCEQLINFLKCQSSIWAGKDTGIMTDMVPLHQTARSSWDPESKKRFSSRQGSCELLQQCALGMQLHTWNSWPTVSILNVFGRHPNWIRKKTTQKEETKKGPAWRWSTKTVANKMLYHILSVTSTFINTNPIPIPEKGSCGWSLPNHLLAHLFGASYHQILISLPSLSKTRKSCPCLLEREGRTRQQVTSDMWIEHKSSKARALQYLIQHHRRLYYPVKSLVFLEGWLPCKGHVTILYDCETVPKYKLYKTNEQ